MNKFFTSLGPFVLTAGSTLLLLLVLLSGTYDHTPLDELFYLEADTSGISGAPDTSRWTLWNRCSVRDGDNYGCTSNKPAYPFQPQSNFGTTSGVPSDFISNHKTYYYLSRFAFAFYFIATGFSAFAFIVGVLALCSRLGAGLASFFSFWALITSATAVSLSIATAIKGRNTFQNAGYNAHIGVKFFAFSWAVVAILLLSYVGFTLACCLGRKKNRHLGDLSDEPVMAEKSKRKPFFRRSKRDKGITDGESQEQVMIAHDEEPSSHPTYSVPSENDTGVPPLNNYEERSSFERGSFRPFQPRNERLSNEPVAV
ncbi:SUR7/PalI family-domain-containing protein [Lipomyces oligophaga]|uniref:SUR7/PalI family-domain-containing protein n=1 Tax=Lipomyces oligophaga TaxID=45792 RepID=UPI0034CE491C